MATSPEKVAQLPIKGNKDMSRREFLKFAGVTLITAGLASCNTITQDQEYNWEENEPKVVPVEDINDALTTTGAFPDNCKNLSEYMSLHGLTIRSDLYQDDKFGENIVVLDTNQDFFFTVTMSEWIDQTSGKTNRSPHIQMCRQTPAENGFEFNVYDLTASGQSYLKEIQGQTDDNGIVNTIETKDNVITLFKHNPNSELSTLSSNDEPFVYSSYNFDSMSPEKFNILSSMPSRFANNNNLETLQGGLVVIPEPEVVVTITEPGKPPRSYKPDLHEPKIIKCEDLPEYQRLTKLIDELDKKANGVGGLQKQLKDAQIEMQGIIAELNEVQRQINTNVNSRTSRVLAAGGAIAVTGLCVYAGGRLRSKAIAELCKKSPYAGSVVGAGVLSTVPGLNTTIDNLRLKKIEVTNRYNNLSNDISGPNGLAEQILEIDEQLGIENSNLNDLIDKTQCQ